MASPSGTPQAHAEYLPLDLVLAGRSSVEEAAAPDETNDLPAWAEAAATAVAGTVSGQGNEDGSPPIASGYITQLYRALMTATRTSAALPDRDDFRYYQSFASFRDKMGQIEARCVRSMDILARLVNPIEAPPAIRRLAAGRAAGQRDAGDQFQVVQDSMDAALEQVDIGLDRLRGATPRKPVLPGAAASSSVASPSYQDQKQKRRRNRQLYIMKPQRKFMDPVDNSHAPWKPLIFEKPNAQRPLSPSLVNRDDAAGPGASPVQSPALAPSVASHLTGLGMHGTPRSRTKHKDYAHPYQYELETLTYLSSQLTPVKEQLYGDIKSTPCHWVDTEDALVDLARKLEDVTELAVDLEHHSYRSYQGFVCLMQISTRSEDFLVDTLVLRHRLHILNSVFTDPAVVKVLHGADRDILWLQQNFGLYVVNMFDTGQCSRVLEFPRFALSYLLKHYCDRDVDKKYQLADWRQRPLTPEMKLYAQEDTHYLLYIYDRMRNELLQKGQNGPRMLRAVLDRSRDLCLQTYKKPQVAPDAAFKFCVSKRLMYTQQQMRVLQALLQWRDETARAEDESPAYVMPNHVMIAVIDAMPLDTTSLLAACKPVPTLVRTNAQSLVRVLQEVRFALPPTPASAASTSLAARPGGSVDAMAVDEQDEDAERQNEEAQEEVQAQVYVVGPEGRGGLPIFDLAPQVKPAATTTAAAVQLSHASALFPSPEAESDRESTSDTVQRVLAGLQGLPSLQAAFFSYPRPTGASPERQMSRDIAAAVAEAAHLQQIDLPAHARALSGQSDLAAEALAADDSSSSSSSGEEEAAPLEEKKEQGGARSQDAVPRSLREQYKLSGSGRKAQRQGGAVTPKKGKSGLLNSTQSLFSRAEAFLEMAGMRGQQQQQQQQQQPQQQPEQPQRKKKKQKKRKTPTQSPAAMDSTVSAAASTQPMVPFDYSKAKFGAAASGAAGAVKQQRKKPKRSPVEWENPMPTGRKPNLKPKSGQRSFTYKSQ